VRGSGNGRDGEVRGADLVESEFRGGEEERKVERRVVARW